MYNTIPLQNTMEFWTSGGGKSQASMQWHEDAAAYSAPKQPLFTVLGAQLSS